MLGANVVVMAVVAVVFVIVVCVLSLTADALSALPRGST